MENQRKPVGEEIDPVSRKTNEEIEADDEGNLIIGGKKVEQIESIVSDEDLGNNIREEKHDPEQNDQS